MLQEPLDEFESTIKEAEKALNDIEEKQKKHADDIIKYFDRIHANLFNLNNIFIVAYIGLIVFKPLIPKYICFIPFINLWILTYIEYRMMEANRSLSNPNSTINDIKKANHRLGNTNLLSLLMILATFTVSCILIAFIFYWI